MQALERVLLHVRPGSFSVGLLFLLFVVREILCTDGEKITDWVRLQFDLIWTLQPTQLCEILPDVQGSHVSLLRSQNQTQGRNCFLTASPLGPAKCCSDFDPGLLVRWTNCVSFTVCSSLLLNVAFLFVCLFVLMTSAFPCQSPANLLSLFFLNYGSYSLICTSLPLLPVLLTVVSVTPPHTHSFIQCLYDSLLLIFLLPFLSPSLYLPLFFLSSPRVTLDPSKRQSSNKSMSGCTLPQGTKTVSKSSFPMFSGCLCLPDCLLAY